MRQKLDTGGCADWQVRFWQGGTDSSGFQGIIIENANEAVCVFKGSQMKGPTIKDDWLVNDVQIGLNRVPSQTASALAMVVAADEIKKPLSITGHSLGGGLAQLIGYLHGLPFVTFNAPGMKNNVPKGFTAPGPARGFNMILWTDPVGNFGKHIGKTERFMSHWAGIPGAGGGLIAHQMGCVKRVLDNKTNWAKKTLAQLI
jgi:hypothetical protein